VRFSLDWSWSIGWRNRRKRGGKEQVTSLPGVVRSISGRRCDNAGDGITLTVPGTSASAKV
jgi:hypothetical protein